MNLAIVTAEFVNRQFQEETMFAGDSESFIISLDFIRRSVDIL